MSARTFGSLFTGGGGAECGAIAAGYTPVFGIELDPSIADVARMNGFDTTVADVRAVDYSAMPCVDHLHASPPCINASQAKADAGETPLDGELAFAVCRAIDALRPETFTLENVQGYRYFDSYKAICQTLTDLGYSYEHWTLNAASYGVPQTRKRLILVARRGEWRIQRPEPTHTKGGDMWLPAWIGWYESIEDLLPTLPESAFADWQLQRLPVDIDQSTFFSNHTAPSLTEGRTPLAQRNIDEPAVTIASNYRSVKNYRAFLMRSQNSQQAGGNQVRRQDDAAMTITAEEKPRAFLVSNAKTEYGDGIRDDYEPCHSVTSQSGGRTRAFIVDGMPNKYGDSITIRQADEPMMTVSANGDKRKQRAWLSQGRVVAMSSRALARFQSFPRTYVLPDKRSLACKVIGNAIPCLLMQRILESIQ